MKVKNVAESHMKLGARDKVKKESARFIVLSTGKVAAKQEEIARLTLGLSRNHGQYCGQQSVVYKLCCWFTAE